MSAPTLLTAALDYAAQGIDIFPLGPRGKLPRIPKHDGGNGYKDATTDDAQIRAWWSRWPRANIGRALGRAYGALVIEDDPRHDGPASLARLEKLYGPLPTLTYTVQSGGGGHHRYFRHPGGFIKSDDTRFGDAYPGVDVKADGGYVVAPPSIHPNGTAYVVTVDRPLADLPQTWIEALLATQEVPAPATRRELAGTDTIGAGDGARWLDWAIAHAGDGRSDRYGLLLAQQLLVNRVDNPEQWLREYAQAASFNPRDPFTERDTLRWLRSAEGSRLVQSGTPARTNISPLRTLRNDTACPSPVQENSPRAVLEFVESDALKRANERIRQLEESLRRSETANRRLEESLRISEAANRRLEREFAQHARILALPTNQLSAPLKVAALGTREVLAIVPDVDPDPLVDTYASQLAKLTGTSEKQAGSYRRKLGELGYTNHVTDRKWVKVVNPETGLTETVPRSHTVTGRGPHFDKPEQIPVLADEAPETADKPGKPAKSNGTWGGARDGAGRPRCSACGSHNVQQHCHDCGHQEPVVEEASETDIGDAPSKVARWDRGEEQRHISIQPHLATVDAQENASADVAAPESVWLPRFSELRAAGVPEKDALYLAMDESRTEEGQAS